MVTPTPRRPSGAPHARATRLGAVLWPLIAAGLMAGLAGCGSSGHHATPTTAPRPTVAPTTSTVPGVQTNGSRTVLSPIGLNVRASPAKSARVVATAAQGVLLTVLGYSADNGGWYQVKGSTATGWITRDPTLSAPGEFTFYTGGRLQFNALYPSNWSVAGISASRVVFQPATGPERIIVSGAASLAALPRGYPGYGQANSSTVVVCGITSDLVTYTRAGAPATDLQYLLQVRLSLDAHHALGITGDLSDQGAQLQAFRNFLYTVTFPFPRCNV